MSLLDRVAGAPITWGVCEVPGWGHQMSRERVLGEIRDLGLGATELGPPGFLPTDPGELRDLLHRHELVLVGAFVSAVLHRRELLEEQLDHVRRSCTTISGSGGTVLVLGPDTDQVGYERSVDMTHYQWAVFRDGVARVLSIAAEYGLRPTLHPHWGMVIERPHHIERLLESTEMPLCLDTGHVMVGGGDPYAIAKLAPERIHHVHLKDVDDDLAARVRAGAVSYHDATANGMYRPLGEGDARIADVVRHLETNGYDGWYVLEQDAVLSAEPAAGSGPIEDARTSYRFLVDLTESS